MSWKAQKSLERVFNTFKRLKNNIYANDIEALKELNNELLLQQKQYATDNLLFAKLLCYVLKYETEHFGGIQPAIKNIDFQLKQPLDYHLQFLQKSLNYCDKINYLKSIEADVEAYAFKGDYSKLKGQEQEFILKLNTNWDYFKVEKAFLNTINAFIKDIDNYN